MVGVVLACAPAVGLPPRPTPALVSVPAAGAATEPRPPPLLWMPAEVPRYEPPPTGEEPAPAPLRVEEPYFQGQRDDELLSHICVAPLRTAHPLGGGSSISLRGVFADGSMAVIKPDQRHVTRYRSEVAAYRLSRALGISKVAPSCIRRFALEELQARLSPSQRTRLEAELTVGRGGDVAAAVIHWIPELHGLRLEKLTWWQPLLRRGSRVRPEQRPRLRDISTLLLFDYLVLNEDRWSGGNTHESEGKMVFVDQGAGFGEDRHGRGRRLLGQLRFCQRFDEEVVRALRHLDLKALAKDLGRYLSDIELRQLLERIEEARAHLRQMEREAPDDWLL